MRELKVCLLVSLLVCSFAAVAHASFISLNTNLSSKVEGDQLKVLVSAVNKGDEPAHNVQAELRLGDQRLWGEKRGQLAVDQTYSALVGFPLKGLRPGQYPLVLTMHYTDANQYPFSALTVQTFAYRAAAIPAEVFGRLKPATFWKEGSTRLTLRNLTDAELKVTVTLATPRELSAPGERQAVVLPPRAERQLAFAVENFSALSGSTYQVYALVEYDKDGRHQASIAPGMLRIREEKKILGLNYIYVVMIAAALALALIVAQFIKK